MSDYHKGNPPLFSIITVTYNAAQTIGPTLESVRSQTFDLYEHIIVDGASSDDTVKIAMDGATTRQLLFSDPDSGLYDATRGSPEPPASMWCSSTPAIHSTPSIRCSRLPTPLSPTIFPG